MEETGQNFEKQIFIALPNFMSHIEFMKFCQNHWSLLCRELQKDVVYLCWPIAPS